MQEKNIFEQLAPYLAAILSALATYLATYFFEKKREKEGKLAYRKYLLENLSLLLSRVIENLEALKLSRNDKSYYPLLNINDIADTKAEFFEMLKNLLSIEDAPSTSELRTGMNDVYSLSRELQFLESVFVPDSRKGVTENKHQIEKDIEMLKNDAVKYNLVYQEKENGAPSFDYIGKNKKDENIELSNYFLLQLMLLRTKINNLDFDQRGKEDEFERRRSLLLPQIVDAKSTVKELLKSVNQKLNAGKK